VWFEWKKGTPAMERRFSDWHPLLEKYEAHGKLRGGAKRRRRTMGNNQQQPVPLLHKSLLDKQNWNGSNGKTILSYI
jgi:hypothetical protein